MNICYLSANASKKAQTANGNEDRYERNYITSNNCYFSTHGAATHTIRIQSKITKHHTFKNQNVLPKKNTLLNESLLA